MFAVDGQQIKIVSTGEFSNQLTSHYQSLLIGESYILLLKQRFISWNQSCGTADSGQHQIDIWMNGSFNYTLQTTQYSGVRESLADALSRFRVVKGDKFGLIFQTLFMEEFGVFLGRQCDYLETIRVKID